ncbi:AmmeMemoRadiSam system radical SAM enzyme [Eubacterium oxidoreducens]|uniref:Pyruvate formate lyase activating enzyme n=1 Tax=Eubacterium oxidoreducens TaxID=1732 RepID=A0A1G6BN94_EUBOX|nr:AmmeMemoRadiSam system radical SAM enzyme [Eubacterium oxidoreducens]SDB22094.1 pyruvate formate lyase activating enzyme [Eubacterium oxidoreducens]
MDRLNHKTIAVCPVCFRHCRLREGQVGFCHARRCKEGQVIADNYGKITALALDPIEKKPLNRFYPGSRIVSVGSYGCNLACPFCQNYEISFAKMKEPKAVKTKSLSPKMLLEIAKEQTVHGNIGVAFTYNEPLVWYEYVRDCAKLLKEENLKTVLVTNGTATCEVLEELLPYIDAMNIDLKGFRKEYYEYVGGNLAQTMKFIERAVTQCHVELTTLIVPGKNDSETEMREMTKWISTLPSGNEIPYHISRYFPRHKETTPPTLVETIYKLTEIAKERLIYVYNGNC